MALRDFGCPHCRKAFRFEDGPAPRQVSCPSCGGRVGIPAAAGRWYYARGGAKVGPLATEGLRALAASGWLGATDMVWQEGTPRWLQASAVPGLFPLPTSAPGRRRAIMPFAVAAGVLVGITALVTLLCTRPRPPVPGTTAPAVAHAHTPPAVPVSAATREPDPPAVKSAPKPARPAPSPRPAHRTEAAIIYPADGQTDVPIQATANEGVPGAAPGKMPRAGYPITAVFRPGVAVRKVTGRLVDAAGQDVAVWLSSPENPADPQFQENTVGLIAREPLRPGTRYRVRLDAEVGGQAWAHAWSFTTAGDGKSEQANARAVVERLNAHRANAGLPPVTLDETLSRGCQAHADYLGRDFGKPATEGLGAHDEDLRLPGASEEGRQAGKASVIYLGGREPVQSPDGWVATLYHRTPLLEPGLKRVGFGCATCEIGWVTVLDSIRGRDPGPAHAPVLYPAPGQGDVPLAFASPETPNPIPQDSDGRAGYPVTVTFAPGVRLERMALSLKDADGRDVPVWFSSPEKPANPAYPRHQGNSVCAIARDPLRPGTAYTVHATGEVDGEKWARQWSFTTLQRPEGAGLAAEVVARLNAHRRAAGLSPVSLDPGLSRGCQAHADYLVRHAGHPSVKGLGLFREDPGQPGYTAEGAAAARNGAILRTVGRPAELVEVLMGALFQRGYALDPALRRVGFACAAEPGRGWICVLDHFRGRDPQTVWPQSVPPAR